MKERFKGKKASLLIEALLATIILSVSLTLIIQSMTSSLRAMTFSSDYAIAITLLENKITEYLQLGGISAGLDEEGSFEGFEEKYQYSVTSEHLDMEDSKINEVELKVSWKSGSRSSSVSLQSFLLDEEQ